MDWLRIPPCCGVLPAFIEKVIFEWVVGLSLPGCIALATISVGLVTVVIAFPLFWAGQMSFEEAQETCRERAFHLREETPGRDLNDMENALTFLLPTHYINAAAILVSLVHFLTWLFLSTHRSNEAQDLDRTRELCTPPH
jgi:hypothetical protein